MIVIYGIDTQLNSIKVELSQAIHYCMQSVLGMPQDKKAHRFIPLAKENFFYPEGRTDAYTVIEINMMKGRKSDTQKQLIKSLFKTIESQVGISPIDLEIVIKEQEPYQWGFRGLTGDEAFDLSYKVNI
jgi:phenylpyruvate tautomerase PptA (4-oxalocrotonate tautomerase family)